MRHTETPAARTAIDAVKRRNLIFRQHLTTIHASHDDSLAANSKLNEAEPACS